MYTKKDKLVLDILAKKVDNALSKKIHGYSMNAQLLILLQHHSLVPVDELRCFAIATITCLIKDGHLILKETDK